MPHDTRIPREIIILLAEEFAARSIGSSEAEGVGINER
jgi:hypothetical protein